MKNVITSSSARNHQDVIPVGRNSEFNNLMNYFWNYFDMPSFSSDVSVSEMEPHIQVIETKDAVKVSAELPGIDEKDLDVKVSADGYLSVCGEKKNSYKTTDKNAYFSEISYGTFKRIIPLPWDLDYEKVSADYNNGVLNISIPKLAEEKQKFKKIAINNAKN